MSENTTLLDPHCQRQKQVGSGLLSQNLTRDERCSRLVYTKQEQRSSLVKFWDNTCFLPLAVWV